MSYRLYLLSTSGGIVAGESFGADNDSDAIAMAVTVYSSCRDEISGYELWKSFTKIADHRSLAEALPWWAVTQVRQRELLDLEDRMQSTFVCLQRSRRLLQASAALRDSSR